MVFQQRAVILLVLLRLRSPRFVFCLASHPFFVGRQLPFISGFRDRAVPGGGQQNTSLSVRLLNATDRAGPSTKRDRFHRFLFFHPFLVVPEKSIDEPIPQSVNLQFLRTSPQSLPRFFFSHIN